MVGIIQRHCRHPLLIQNAVVCRHIVLQYASVTLHFYHTHFHPIEKKSVYFHKGVILHLVLHIFANRYRGVDPHHQQ